MFCWGIIPAQFITVDNTSYTPQQLVEKFIGTNNSSCVTISNVTVSGGNLGGSDSSYGYFQNGSQLGMNEGIILSTGTVLAAPGPKKRTIQSATANGWAGDPDLASVVGIPISEFANATILEFDFTATLSNKVSFRYLFLSEEYHPGNYSYSDAFAFLIKKTGSTDPYTNIAVVPGTNTPVSTTTINDRENSKYFDGFIGYYSNTNGTNDSATNFNGQTKILTAIANVEAGVNYHIKLVIADEGRNANSQYDSAVFLEAGSFTGNINLLPDLDTDDAAVICKGNAVRLEPKNPADINDSAAKYFWTEANSPSIILSNNSYYDTNVPGDYRLRVELSSGCTLEGNVKLENAPVPVVDSTPIMVCDSDFDGKYAAVLSEYNARILTNFSRDFSINYYTATGTLIDPDQKFELTQNPQIINVSIGALSCTPEVYPVQFYHGAKLSMTDNLSFDVCDSDRNNTERKDLADYLTQITSETGYTATYFDKEDDAKKGGNSTIGSSQNITSDKSFYIRIEKTGACANYVKINLRFKQPRKSSLLPEEPIMICKAVTTNLQAETGFDYYEWSTGVKGQFANEITNVPAGNYWVKLTSNGCVYQQYVQVKEAENPIIDNVLIQGSTITIQVSGGTKPYQYALDNGNYQSSNVFNNVTLGNHTVYVQGKDGCAIVSQNFSLINTQNVITPNQDGANDVIDYSSLSTKLDPRLEIYDRSGVLIFKGDSNNQFIWDGKQNGRVLPTASYWYILEWNEAGNPERTRITGWILLKNRN